jgi:hypothetical protein
MSHLTAPRASWLTMPRVLVPVGLAIAPGRRQEGRAVEQERLNVRGGEVVEARELEQRLELAARDLRHRAPAP